MALPPDAPATVAPAATPAAAPAAAVGTPSAAPAAVPSAAPPAPAAPGNPAAAPAAAEPAPATDPTPPAAEPAAAAPEPAAAPPPDTPSLLGEAGKPATAEAAPAAPDAPAQPAPAPIAYEFKFPEGITATADELKPFTDVLGEVKAPPEQGQKLLDLHLAETQKTIQRVNDHNAALWNDTRRDWVDQVKADPEIGGNRFETNLALAGGLITQYGGSVEQQQELRAVLNLTGAGDHPAVVRFLTNIARAKQEGQPIPAPAPQIAAPSRAQRRYAGTNMNGAA